MRHGLQSKKPAGPATRRLPDLMMLRFDLSSDLDQRPTRGRALRPAATGTARFRLARNRALARARQLFRLRHDRALDEFEADLVAARRLVLDQHDANVAAALELAEQHLV